MPSDHPPEGEPYTPIAYTSDVFPTERADSNYPPVREHAHHTRQGHKKKTRSRYHPRPQPRRRMDFMGFNAWMWLCAVVLIVVLLFAF
jgi:hypothetical protein